MESIMAGLLIANVLVGDQIALPALKLPVCFIDLFMPNFMMSSIHSRMIRFCDTLSAQLCSLNWHRCPTDGDGQEHYLLFIF